MDPNAALKLIAELLEVKDYEGARLAVDDLRRWIRSGGFAPEWHRFPAATAWIIATYVMHKETR